MAKSAFENKLQGFAERVKTEPVQIPLQKVTPIEQTPSPKEEQQLNVWIPKELMKRLKMKGAETDQSLKEMVIEALNKFI
jgi:predicted HicB family RNase H-like nuclease